MFDKSTSTEHRLGYLLLRDGHAIPLRDISPEDIKQGAKGLVSHPDADPLKHRRTLDAIVDRLGFDGDFGSFKNKGWPEFQRFLAKNHCTQRGGVFPADHGGSIDLHFGPTAVRPRQLADRIFESPQSMPSRVFLGHGVDWSAWDNGNGIHVPAAAIASINASPEEAIQLAQELFSRRHDLMGQWGFLDDKLIGRKVCSVVDKSYWPRGSDPRERLEHEAKTTAAVIAFRAVFDKQHEGWVTVLQFNARLVVLRAHDGRWDLLWRCYRDEAPPQPKDVAETNSLAVEDLPSRLMTKSNLHRAIHFRQEFWDEYEAHEAEQAFYDRGGSIEERQLTSDIEVRVAWLHEKRLLRVPERARWEGALPGGFHAVTLGGRKVAVSTLVTVSEFRQMLMETGYEERRFSFQEPWDRGNAEDLESAPVCASWMDAQAYCAWRERQLGISLRLPTREELRAIRPAHSQHYESMAFKDFPWEHFPPRQTQPNGVEVASSVSWSEPRFVASTPSMPEFPDLNGLALHSRRKWVKDFPPQASWRDPIPWAEYKGLAFIDAWDAYEWCQERGIVSGRFWEGEIGAGSWGAYKNMKICFRVVLDLEGVPDVL